MSERVTARLRRVLAPNPGVMTLDGTNTWLLREPGAPEVLVVDPGPADEGHRREILRAAGARGGRVTHILLTHHHHDHSEGARSLAEATGAELHGGGAGRPLREGPWPAGGALALEVLLTPGHTRDSVCLLLPAEGTLLTGDTVLGRGTTVLADDGDLSDYLASLDRLIALARDRAVRLLAPGHGPAVDRPAQTLRALREHRQERLAAVRELVGRGIREPEAVVTAVYGPMAEEPERREAALWNVRAQLRHLGVLDDAAGQEHPA